MSSRNSLQLALKLLYRAIWAPLLVVIIHGLLAAWIGHYRQLDPIFHFVGGLAGAFCLDRSIPLFTNWLGDLSWLGRKAFAFTGTCTAIVFWELLEFVSDLNARNPSQLSVSETMVDMLLGVVGAGAYLGGDLLRRRLGKH